MSIIKLSDINAKTCSELDRYNNDLKCGVYHLLDFKILTNPTTLRVTAFLDCVEGKFSTTSVSIVRELIHHVGNTIRDVLQQPDVESIEIEVVPYRLRKNGRVYGIAFRMSNAEPPSTSNTIIDEIPSDEMSPIVSDDFKVLPPEPALRVGDTVEQKEPTTIAEPEISHPLSLPSPDPDLVDMIEPKIPELTEAELRSTYDELLAEYKKTIDPEVHVKLSDCMMKISERIAVLQSVVSA